MSSLGDYLFKRYGGHVPTNPQEVAFDAIQRFGSGRAAARELGVDEKTIRRWKSGQTQQSETVEKYAREVRQSTVEKRTGPVSIEFRHARRDRTLAFREGGGERGLKAGTEAAIAQAYVSGDREGMARAFLDGLPRNWYGRELRRAYVAELEGAPGEAGEDSDAVGLFPAA